MTEKILRLPDLRQCTGLSRSAIYQLLAEGRFPPPIKLGRRSVGWLATEVADWLAARVRERNGEVPPQD